MKQHAPRRFLDPHWMQQGIDALRATLDVDARTKRDMIEFLFAEGFWDASRLSYDAAVARFNACLNPGKPEFFKLGEVWALSKRFSRFDLLQAMAYDLGFELRPLANEERRQALLERIAVAMERAASEREACMAELARIDAPVPELRLDPAIRAGTGTFSMPPDDVTGF